MGRCSVGCYGVGRYDVSSFGNFVGFLVLVIL